MSKLAKISNQVMPPNCAKCGAVCYAAFTVTTDDNKTIKVCGACWLALPRKESKPWKPGKPSISITGGNAQ